MPSRMAGQPFWTKESLERPRDAVFSGLGEPRRPGRWARGWAVVGLCLMGLPGCGGAEQRTSLILATTTSIYDSGLLDVLIPEFEKTQPYQVKVIAVGTGEALRMGERGDADVLFVHAPQAEQPFMERGLGTLRKAVMHNDFVLVGPADDPVQARGQDMVSAFRKIAAGGATFVSRADRSGTHQKELALWEEAGIRPQGPWYVETGQGMGESLRIAHEKKAYILTDRGTWVVFREKLALTVLVEGSAKLQNPYHVIVVSPEVHPQVNLQGAEAFVEFLTSPTVQQRIGQFGKPEYGEALFVPDAIAQ